MADDGLLRVDPTVMNGFRESLSGAADHLQARLAELDGQVGEMLGGWQGGSGAAYSSAWQLWHRGAAEVQQGLAALAWLVGRAGLHHGDDDAGSAGALRSVADG